MAETPLPNLIHDPPSLPNSPHHKRTKKIEPSAGAIGNIAEGRETPTPTVMASHTAVPGPAVGAPPPAAQQYQQPLQLQVKFLSDKARAPTRGSAFAAGYDLYSSQDTVVPGRGKAMVETDISIAVPEGTYGRVAPRSGLAAKHSIDTGAGVIDADYRGPLKVILFNFGETDFAIKQGDRIAQLIIERIYTPDVVVVQQLADSVRGAGGFGSTGGFATNADAQAAAAQYGSVVPAP